MQHKILIQIKKKPITVHTKHISGQSLMMCLNSWSSAPQTMPGLKFESQNFNFNLTKKKLY